MKLNELLNKEGKGNYTLIYATDGVVEYDSVLGFLTDATSEAETNFLNSEVTAKKEVNGVEFYQFLTAEQDQYVPYELLDEEQQKQLRQRAVDEYDYTINDTMLIVTVE